MTYIAKDELGDIRYIMEQLDEINGNTTLSLGDLHLFDSNGDDLGYVAYESQCESHVFHAAPGG